MTAADVRPDYDPSDVNGALIGVVAAVVVTALAVTAGFVTLLIFILDGTR